MVALGPSRRRSTWAPGYQILINPMKASWWLFAVVTLLLCMQATSNLATAWAIRQVFDGIQTHQAQMTYRGSVEFGIAILATAALTFTLNYLRQLYGLRVMITLRQQAMDRVTRATIPFHDQYPTDDIQSRLSGDIWQAYHLVAWSYFALIQQPLFMIGASIYLWTLSRTMALFVVPIGPILMLLQKFWREPLYLRGKAVQEMAATVNQYSLETLSGIGAVKTMQLEPSLRRQYGRLIDQVSALHRREWRTQAVFGFTTDWISSVPFIAIVAIGGIWALHGHLESGTLIAAIQLMNYIIGPFGSVARSWSEVQTGRASLDRIALLTSAPLEADDEVLSQANPVLASASETIRDMNLDLAPG